VSHGLFDLTGKTAVVIGGGSGIGEALVLGLAKQGARLVCLDVNQEAARQGQSTSATARPLTASSTRSMAGTESTSRSARPAST
jgi:NAD(P)-dependent dehydrogenase (short-subunit alcohol dehydrogenase family)